MYIRMCVYTCSSVLSESWHPNKQKGYLVPRFWLLNTLSSKKNWGFLEKVKNELEKKFRAKKQKNAHRIMEMCSRFKRGPTDYIWDNMGIKINNVVRRL